MSCCNYISKIDAVKPSGLLLVYYGTLIEPPIGEMDLLNPEPLFWFSPPFDLGVRDSDYV